MANNSKNLYVDADRAVKVLKYETDYTVDEKTKSVTLDEKGIKAGEKYFKVKKGRTYNSIKTSS